MVMEDIKDLFDHQPEKLLQLFMETHGIGIMIDFVRSAGFRVEER